MVAQQNLIAVPERLQVIVLAACDPVGDIDKIGAVVQSLDDGGTKFIVDIGMQQQFHGLRDTCKEIPGNLVLGIALGRMFFTVPVNTRTLIEVSTRTAIKTGARTATKISARTAIKISARIATKIGAPVATKISARTVIKIGAPTPIKTSAPTAIKINAHILI